MFGRNAQSSTGSTLRSSLLRGQQEDLSKLEADMREARRLARDGQPRDLAADRALQRGLSTNIAITKANIRDLGG